MTAKTSVAIVDSAISLTGSVIDEGPLVNRYLVIAHCAIGMSFLLLSLLAGFLYSLQFIGWYPFGSVEYLNAGRIHFVQTNTLVYGFLVNMLIAGLYWVVPRSNKQRVLNNRLGWLLFSLWNFAVILAIPGFLTGYAQGVEWGETPNGLMRLIGGEAHIFFVDELIVLGFVLLTLQFFVPLLLAGVNAPLYISSWYFTAGLLWGLLAYLVGNYLPEVNVFPGAVGVLFVGIFVQGLMGLFLGALGWGMLYYFVPAITKKPVWSRSVALLGFWGLPIFYPLSSVQHYIYSPVPKFIQYGSIVALVAVEIIITTTFVNFFMILRGRETYLRTSIPIRYFYTGLILYLVVSFQAVLQTQFWVSEFVQFTDWITGHFHLLLYGVFGFWMLGCLTDLWPRLTGKPAWYSRGLNEWAYWLNLVGILGMFISLTAGGLIEGFLWKSLATWESQLNSLQMPWRFHTVTLVFIILANSLTVFNMLMTALPAQVHEVKYAKPAQLPAAVGD
jgi:cytochrome c oxidase cbb3-type subunit 1